MILLALRFPQYNLLMNATFSNIINIIIIKINIYLSFHFEKIFCSCKVNAHASERLSVFILYVYHIYLQLSKIPNYMY